MAGTRRLLRAEICLVITLSIMSTTSIADAMTTVDLNVTSSPTSIPQSFGDHDATTMMPVTTLLTDTNVSHSFDSDENGTSEKIPIYLGGFFTLGGNWDGSGILPAVEMALDHINNRPDLLADYDLRMVWNDTQCDAGLGTKILFDQIFREPQKLMILGPACSTATQAVAGTAHYWNLVTMSYSASSPALTNDVSYPLFYRTYAPDTLFNPARIRLIREFRWTRVATIHENHEIFSLMSYAAASSILSNRNKYPLFYRTYMPDAMYNPARVRLIKENGWTRVATIHENHELFSLAIDNLLTLLRQANITIITSESFSENPRNQVANLKNQDAKIILANMYENMARRVFCEAYKQGLTGEGFVWFLIGWYSDGWYQVPDPDVTCTIAQMKEAVEGSYYIATESLQLSPRKEPGISGLTAETYTKEIRQRLDSPRYFNLNYTFNNLAPFGYDATWAVALMLNRSVEVLKTMTFKDGVQRKLETFTYEDKEMADLFFGLLNETEFIGITGPVSFKSGDRVGITQIEQLQRSLDKRTLRTEGTKYFGQSKQVHSRLHNSFLDTKEMGCKSNQFEVDSSCLTFATDMKTWSEARSICSGDSTGDRAFYTPSLDGIALLLEIASTTNLGEGNATNRWYIGLSIDSDGRFSDVNSLLNQSDLDELSDTLISSWTPSSVGCVVVDLNPDVGDDTLMVVDCNQRYPYICSESRRFLEQRLGLYDTAGDILDWNSRSLIWAGNGKPPLDRTPEIIIVVKDIYMGIDTYLYIIMSIFACVGILFAVFFLAFNLKYRNQKFVKLSSPNLNNLIILGSVMIYSWIFLLGLDGNLVSFSAHQAICQLRTWVISIGFVIAFGAMFSKTWRVHRVATFKIRPRKRAIRDTQLYLIILFLVAVDFIILLVWQIVDPMILGTRDLFPMEDPNDELVMLQPYVMYCVSTYQTYWLVVMYIYKGILLLFGTFLAWETRKVKIPALNDSKLIGISVYNVFILCAIGVGVSYALQSDPAALFIFISFVALFCTTITLGVVFIPKIISVYKDPLGEHATGKRNRNSGLETTDIRSSTGVEYTTELSASAASADKDHQKLQDKVDSLQKQLQGTKDLNAILKDTDDNMCGVWCCGLSCGCSYRHGCFYADDDDESQPRYTIKKEESSSGADVYTGGGKSRDPAKRTASKDGANGNCPSSNGQTAGATASPESVVVVEVEAGVANGAYVANSDDGAVKVDNSSDIPAITTTEATLALTSDLQAWKSSTNLSEGVSCNAVDDSMEASNVTVIPPDDALHRDEDEC